MRFDSLRGWAAGARLWSLFYRLALRFRFRYDLFISYSRVDGEYADALQKQLAKLEFTCFFDREEITAGSPLTDALKRALRSSARLLLIGSPAALQSKYVAMEVEEFQRLIIPIDFGGSIKAASWPALSQREVVWIDESREALDHRTPSAHVALDVEKEYKYTKRSTALLVRRIAILILFVTVVIIATVLNRLTTIDKQRATERASSAERSASEQQARARDERKRADDALKAATTAQAEAAQQQQAAEDASRVAHERLIDTSQEQGRLQLLRNERQQALIYLRDAYAQRPNDEALRFLLHTAARSVARDTYVPGARSAHWSPAGDRFVTAGKDARVWDVAGNPLITFREEGEPADARCAAFFDQGRQVVTVGKSIAIWSANGSFSRKLERKDAGLQVDQCSISADGKRLLTIERGSGPNLPHVIRVTDLEGGASRLIASEYEIYIQPRDWNRVGFDPAGDYVAVVHDGVVGIYDSRTGGQPVQVFRSGRERHYIAAVWSPDGKYVATADREAGSATIWEMKHGSFVRTIDHDTQPLTAMAFSPDSKTLLTGGEDGRIFLWDIMSFAAIVGVPERKRELFGHRGRIAVAAYSSDGTRLVTLCCDRDRKDGPQQEIRIWDPRSDSSSALDVLPIGNWRHHPVQVSADGRHILALSGDQVTIWDGSQDLRIRTLMNGDRMGRNLIEVSGDGRWIVQMLQDRLSIRGVPEGPEERSFEVRSYGARAHALDRDGTLLALVRQASDVSVFDLRTGKEIGPVDPGGVLEHIRFSGDGRYLFTATSSEVRVWTMPDRKHVQTIAGLGSIAKVLVSEDGETLATIESLPDGLAVIVWDWRSKRRLLDALSGRDAVFTRDGTLIAVTHYSEVSVYTVRTGQRLARFRDHQDKIRTVEFSEDGTRAVSTSDDRTARIWSTRTGGLLQTLGVDATSAAFSHAGNRVIASDASGALSLWDVRRGHLLFRLQGHTRAVRSARFVANDERIISIAGPVEGEYELIEWDAGVENRPLQEIDLLIKKFVGRDVFNSVVRQNWR